MRNRIFNTFSSSFALILDAAARSCLANEKCSVQFSLFSITFPTSSQLALAANVAHVFLLCFPLIFVLGLLPQINTFALYLLEQIDIHTFGGNAMSSLTSALYCVARSLLAVGTLIGFAYGGLTGEAHTQHTQEILFSIFCCLTMAVGYHLSRCSADPTVIFSLIRRQLLVTTVNAELETAEEGSGNKNPMQQQERSASPTQCPAAPATNVKEGKSSSSAAGDDNIGESPSTSSSPSSTTAVNPVYDPLPKKLRSTVNARLKNDAIMCVLIAAAAFLLHVSGVFTKLQPNLNYVLWTAASVSGFLCHYILPQLRKQLPWLCFSHPLLKSHEYDHFEVRQAARVMWFERIYVMATFIEKNLIYPMVFLSALSTDLEAFKMMPPLWGALVMTVTSLKCFRAAYSDCSRQYFILLLTVLVFRFDPESRNVIGMTTGSGSRPGQHSSWDPFMLHYFVISIIFHKLFEFYLKVQFVITYIAPWQITWGSAFHAFAQPFSVPHSAMLFLQAGISAVFSTPLNPILGSAIFCTSYVRPVKFWERDYNTKRSDHSNTRLSSHLDRNPAAAGGIGADDNNLNSIFYEHLTRSLQVRKDVGKKVLNLN